MPVPAGLRAAVTAAIARTDTAWALNRPKAMDRTRDAVMAAIEPILAQALSVAHIEGVHQGVAQGRTQALHEAATMLKRHGHRSAVTRLLALADEPVKTPARPQPVNASPAGGPGPSEPQDGIYDYGTRTWHPVPTPPENGAQRGAQGRVEAYARDVQERLTHD